MGVDDVDDVDDKSEAFALPLTFDDGEENEACSFGGDGVFRKGTNVDIEKLEIVLGRSNSFSNAGIGLIWRADDDAPTRYTSSSSNMTQDDRFLVGGNLRFFTAGMGEFGNFVGDWVSGVVGILCGSGFASDMTGPLSDNVDDEPDEFERWARA